MASFPLFRKRKSPEYKKADEFFCFLLTIGGTLFGVLLLKILGIGREAQPLPILSAFATETPVISLVADYAGEVRLFLPMVLLPCLVKHPLPLYALLVLRGLYFGLSSAYLFAFGAPTALCVSYLLVNGGVLMAYTFLAHLVTKSPWSLRPLAFPFLFYAGEIFLLTVIRNLIYCLFLP